MKAVSNLLLRPHGRPRYRTVLALGDTQYTCGGLAAYQQSYGPHVGPRVRRDPAGRRRQGLPDDGERSRRDGLLGLHPARRTGSSPTSGPKPSVHPGPTPGSGAYYSFNVPNGLHARRASDPCWHFIALNGNCDKAIGCMPGTDAVRLARRRSRGPSEHVVRLHARLLAPAALLLRRPREQRRLRCDLAAAVPREGRRRAERARARLRALRAAEPRRRAPIPNGIREFIVGTGGASHVRFPSRRAPAHQPGQQRQHVRDPHPDACTATATTGGSSPRPAARFTDASDRPDAMPLSRDPIADDATVIFLHVGKTAGATMRRALRKEYPAARR